MKEKIILITIVLLFCIGLISGWLLAQQPLLFLALAGMFGLLLFAQTVYYLELRREPHQPNENYRQVESLFFLFSAFKFRYPLPAMRGWAISPDFACTIISLIREKKPKLVLELGSGVSTLVAAYSLEQAQGGRVISLDHDAHFAAISAANIVKHELQHIATVKYAPLQAIEIRGQQWLWYDMEQLRDLGPIDMLIVDGPPATTQKLARYPALPVLLDRLSDDAVIILDDASRRDETEIVKRWLQEFGSFSLEKIDAEKGAAILRHQRP